MEASQKCKLAPVLARELPPFRRRAIGLIGATGKVGFELVALLARSQLTEEVLLYCRSRSSQARLELFLSDLCAPPFLKTTRNLTDLERVPMIILCAGLSTVSLNGPNKKERLLQINFDIARSHLEGLRADVAIVVTNPTTRLIQRLQPLLPFSLIGVGVENDSIRYQRSMKSHDTFLVGAHNLHELVAGTERYETSLPHDVFDLAEYRHLSSLSDTLTKMVDMDEIDRTVRSVPPHLRWWLAQSLVSRLLPRRVSCAIATMNVVNYLAGSDSGASIETEFVLPDERGLMRKAIIGWPMLGNSDRARQLWFSSSSRDAVLELISSYGSTN